jgi:hypothetical protein
VSGNLFAGVGTLEYRMEYDVPTWSQIYDMLMDEAREIQAENFHPDVVVGIVRGGLIPARVLVDLLDVPQFATVQIPPPSTSNPAVHWCQISMSIKLTIGSFSLGKPKKPCGNYSSKTGASGRLDRKSRNL